MKLGIIVLFVCFPFTLFASADREVQDNNSLVIFNAASTTDMIIDLSELYQQKTGVQILSNPASSGTLAKQLSQGAPADIYISASIDWLLYTEEQELVEDSSPFACNSLVLIAPAESEYIITDLSNVHNLGSLFSGYLSIGDAAHVPAGRYAEEALSYYGWLDELRPRILPGANVRAALLVVELGEAELGIVYKTDALKSDKVKIVADFPEESHTPVEYFCALLKNASPAAQDFYEFLLHNREAEAVYLKYGFSSTNSW